MISTAYVEIDRHAGSGRPVTISLAFSCMTTEVVSEYAFAKSAGFLDNPDFNTNLHDAIMAGQEVAMFLKPFPWLFKGLKAQLREVKEGKAPKSGIAGTTIFHELLNSKVLPKREKTVERLWQEGQVVIGAGTETTAWTLSVIVFYLLSNTHVLFKLRQELEAAIPDPSTLPPLTGLEQLPYLICLPAPLTIIMRLPRIAPHEPLVFKPSDSSQFNSVSSSQNSKTVEWVIPPGTPVGMTSALMHHHPALFPNSKAFIPERWIDENGKRRHDLEGCILSFSKGSRQCLGINLAYAELYMTLAAVVRRFGDRLQLYETTTEDVVMHRDIFIPVPKAGSKGIRVLVS
ncbi:hypothetical protein VTN00DRAFT_4184 [Thermoascus crustaceus]|uniref:uncharacterized protein n=1 Tax=Thermoascus crustaceus TaxID=5088 RepID=UPI0037436BF5